MVEEHELSSRTFGGASSGIFLAIDANTQQQVAIKQVPANLDNDGIPAEVLREIGILRTLQHPNILRLLDVFMRQSYVAYVFEVKALDLRIYLQSSPQPSLQAVRLILKQTLAAVVICHARRILHRDIKPESIFMDNIESVCLGGFHSARPLTTPGKPYTRDVQTLWYRAPEILLGSACYSTSIDVWSAGCTLAEMYLGKPLFEGNTEYEQLAKICSVLGVPKEAEWPGVSTFPNYNAIEDFTQTTCLDELIGNSEVASLLKCMLKLNPGERISARECLEHPFFAEPN